MDALELLETELASVDEIMDIIAGNVLPEDLEEFKKAGVRMGHA